MTAAYGIAAPGTKPHRPQHVPAPPSGVMPDPGGQTAAERVHRIQQQAATVYTNWRNSFPQGIDPQELKDSAGMFSVSDTALALPEALASVKADSDAATAHVSHLLNSQRVGDDTGAQIAAQRYWVRAQRTLEAQKDPAKAVAAARNLIDSASAAQIPVLAEELSSYLASRGVPTGWLAGAMAASIPGLPEASSAATVAARQYAILAKNHHSLTNSFAKDVGAPPLLDPAIATATPYSDYGGTGGE
jgi:hypothetical protein